MAEDKDYIEEAQSEAQLRFGRILSPDELADKFKGHDLEARVYHLKTLKMPDVMTVKEAADRYSYTSALNNVHERLRKVDR